MSHISFHISHKGVPSACLFGKKKKKILLIIITTSSSSLSRTAPNVFSFKIAKMAIIFLTRRISFKLFTVAFVYSALSDIIMTLNFMMTFSKVKYSSETDKRCHRLEVSSSANGDALNIHVLNLMLSEFLYIYITDLDIHSIIICVFENCRLGIVHHLLAAVISYTPS